MKRFFSSVFLGLLFCLLFEGCDKKGEGVNELRPLNSFQMYVNNKLWTPSVIDNDSCYSTFQCNMSGANGIPFYNIDVYNDPEMRTDTESAQIFKIQVMNVSHTGIHEISGSYIDQFTSYALFINNENGIKTVYQNSTTNSVLKIEEFFTIDSYSELQGIRGSFEGVLYNISDSNDSIIIYNCHFTFKKINRYNYCQCAE